LSDCSCAFCERSFVCLFLFALEKKWNIEMDGMCEGGRCAVCCCCCCCCVCVSVWYVFVCLYRSHMRGCLVVGPLRAITTTYYYYHRGLLSSIERTFSPSGSESCHCHERVLLVCHMRVLYCSDHICDEFHMSLLSTLKTRDRQQWQLQDTFYSNKATEAERKRAFRVLACA